MSWFGECDFSIAGEILPSELVFILRALLCCPLLRGAAIDFASWGLLLLCVGLCALTHNLRSLP